MEVTVHYDIQYVYIIVLKRGMVCGEQREENGYIKKSDALCAILSVILLDYHILHNGF